MVKIKIMKNLFLVFLTFLSVSLFAQENQFVEVTYVMEMDMDADEVIASIPQEYRAMVEDQLRQELSDGIFIDYTLKTNGNESVYQMVEQISNAQSAGGMIASQIRAADNQVTYVNISEGMFLKPVDIMGAKYLIKDELQDHQWQISREKVEIAGYETRYATGVMTLNDTVSPVKAWFATNLPIKAGPSSLWGLPGLILKAEFESNGAQIVLTAKEIAVLEKPITIKRPEGGKEVTMDEFTTEMKAIQAKFQENMEGGVDKE